MNREAARWYPYLWIILFGYLLYQQILGFNFTFFDDNILILDNLNFLKNPANVLQAFRQNVFHAPNSPILYYRPLLTVSFMIDSWIGGLSPFVYHLTNIIIHIIASCLLYLFFIKLKYRRESALFLSFIFVAHPVLTQAVAWIPGRNDSLLAVFILSSFIALMRFLETGKRRFYISHVALFMLALFTKESAITAIALYVSYYFLIWKTGSSRAEKKMLVMGWAVAAILWFYLRRSAIGSAAGLNIIEIGKSVILNIKMVVQSIGKIILPFNLSVFPVKGDTTSIYGIIAIILFAGMLFKSRYKRIEFIVFGLSWFILFLLPSFVRPSPEISAPHLDFSEHRLYLPLIGFLIAAFEIDAIKNINLRKTGPLVLAIFALAIFSTLTLNHSENFKNRVSFWNNAFKTSPHSSWVRLNIGMIYYIKGELDKAEAEYRKSLELNPQQPLAHAKLGLIHVDRNMSKEAEAEFKKELAINPLYDGTWVMLGTLYYKEGRFKEAESMWKMALEMNPDNFDARKNLVIYYCENKNLREAARHVRELQKRGVTIPQNILDIVGE